MGPVLITTPIFWFESPDRLIDLDIIWYDFDDKTQVNNRTITKSVVNDGNHHLGRLTDTITLHLTHVCVF